MACSYWISVIGDVKSNGSNSVEWLANLVPKPTRRERFGDKNYYNTRVLQPTITTCILDNCSWINCLRPRKRAFRQDIKPSVASAYMAQTLGIGITASQQLPNEIDQISKQVQIPNSFQLKYAALSAPCVSCVCLLSICSSPQHCNYRPLNVSCKYCWTRKLISFLNREESTQRRTTLDSYSYSDIRALVLLFWVRLCSYILVQSQEL